MKDCEIVCPYCLCIIAAFTPLCENLPSGTATKPGDVHTAMNGKTVQVGFFGSGNICNVTNTLWY